MHRTGRAKYSGNPDVKFLANRWQTIPENLVIPYSIAKYVRMLYSKGMKQVNICKFVGLDKQSVNKIVKNRSHIIDTIIISSDQAIRIGVIKPDNFSNLINYEYVYNQ